MKNKTANRIKKITAGLVCCGLCVATGLFGTLAITKMSSVSGKKAYANGFVTIEDGTDSLTIDRIDESFFAPGNLGTTPSTDHYFKYNQKAKDWIMPGGNKSGSVTVTNNGKDAVAVIVYARSSEESKFSAFWEKNKDNMDYSPTQLKYLSDLLVSDENKMTLKIYLQTPEGEDLVYSGSVDGKGSSDAEINSKVEAARSNENKMNGEDNAIFLGYLFPDMAARYPSAEEWKFDFDEDNPYGYDYDPSYEPNTATFRFELEASKGLKSYLEGTEYANFPKNRAVAEDHGFAGSIAMIDWVFVIPPSSVLSPDFPEETTTTTTTITTTTTTTTKYVPSPGTGEEPNLYLFAAAACGISALVIFFVAFGDVGKKKKKEE